MTTIYLGQSAPGNRRPIAVFYTNNGRSGLVISGLVIKAAALSAALLATALSSEARAQAAVEDPGYCAQYYPNANCDNYGPGNPLYRGSHGQYFAPGGRPDGYAAAPRRYHHRRHHG